MPDLDLAAVARTAVADVIGDLAHDQTGLSERLDDHVDLARLDDAAQAALCEQLAAEIWKVRSRIDDADADAARATADRLRYERQLLGAARRILDLVAAGSPDRWDQIRAEAEDVAQRIVDEIGHPITDEPALGPHYRGKIAALGSEIDRLYGENTRMAGEIAQLRALLGQAADYARGIQDGACHGECRTGPTPDTHAIADAEEGEIRSLVGLIRNLIDSDECWFDHHGGCQAHGYLDLEPGEVCPQQAAKDVLARHAADGGAA